MIFVVLPFVVAGCCIAWILACRMARRTTREAEDARHEVKPPWPDDPRERMVGYHRALSTGERIAVCGYTVAPGRWCCLDAGHGGEHRGGAE